MSLRWRYTAPAGQFEQTAARIRDTIATAATLAMADVGEYAKTRGRANIASAGFSEKWQNALRVNVYPTQGRVALDPVALCYHKIPYAGVFEDGATIAGSPLLWLPLPNVPTRLGNRHMTPANYIRQIGPLHKIERGGKLPLLAGYMIGARTPITIARLRAGAKASQRRPGAPMGRLVSVPLFFGLNTVTLGKRFDLMPIFANALDQFGEFYLKNLRV